MSRYSDKYLAHNELANPASRPGEKSFPFQFTARAVGPRWIPVSERLPEDSQRVLVCCADGRQYVAATDGGFWSDGREYSDHIHDITHWMPLPEAPK